MDFDLIFTCCAAFVLIGYIMKLCYDLGYEECDSHRRQQVKPIIELHKSDVVYFPPTKIKRVK